MQFDNIEKLNQVRKKYNFLTIEELLLLSETNTIFDPFSLLISANITLADNNIFYPNVILQASDNAKLTIKANNTFFPNTLIVAEKGIIEIGTDNQFGEGGCVIKTTADDMQITVGNNGRYTNGAFITGNTHLGNGSQILGAITVKNCILASGKSWQEQEPDERGAVLKGMGIAQNISLSHGEVISAQGSFKKEAVQLQSFYHPKK